MKGLRKKPHGTGDESSRLPYLGKERISGFVLTVRTKDVLCFTVNYSIYSIVAACGSSGTVAGIALALALRLPLSLAHPTPSASA
jgi:hypothetical protein